MEIKVEIFGYKAVISSIKPSLADPPFRKEDEIFVYLELEEPVDGTAGFGIYLPVKEYRKEEFLSAVQKEGEKALKRILEVNRAVKLERVERERRENELHSLVERIWGRLKK